MVIRISIMADLGLERIKEYNTRLRRETNIMLVFDLLEDYYDMLLELGAFKSIHNTLRLLNKHFMESININNTGMADLFIRYQVLTLRFMIDEIRLLKDRSGVVPYNKLKSLKGAEPFGRSIFFQTTRSLDVGCIGDIEELYFGDPLRDTEKNFKLIKILRHAEVSEERREGFLRVTEEFFDTIGWRREGVWVDLDVLIGENNFGLQLFMRRKHLRECFSAAMGDGTGKMTDIELVTFQKIYDSYDEFYKELKAHLP